jgi:nucleoside permease NupC
MSNFFFIILYEKIQWKLVIIGLLIQFILAVFLLRVEFGYKLFKFISDQVIVFLDYTDAGSELVFGASFRDHFFAMKVI